MLSIKNILLALVFLIIPVSGNADNPPKRDPNRVIINPGIIFPTNYNAPIPQPKKPFVPVIENQTDSSPMLDKKKNAKVRSHSE